MTLHELCDQYLLAGKVEKGYTRETLRTFHTRIRAFVRFVGEDSTLADFTLLTLKRYLYHLVGRRQRPRTVKAGLGRTVHPHDLRHAFARRALANGMEISVLQIILGHARLNTTAMYLMTDSSRLREAAALGALRSSVPPPSPQTPVSRRAEPPQPRRRLACGKDRLARGAVSEQMPRSR